MANAGKRRDGPKTRPSTRSDRRRRRREPRREPRVGRRFRRGGFESLASFAKEKERRKPLGRRRGAEKRRDATLGRAARGVDSADVRTVINPDVPPSASAYLHRVGRTGRAGKSGTAITLVSPAETPAFEAVKTALARDGGDAGAAAAAAMAPFQDKSEPSSRCGTAPEENGAVRGLPCASARARAARGAAQQRAARRAPRGPRGPEPAQARREPRQAAADAAPVAPARVPARPQEAGRRRGAALDGDGKKLGVGKRERDPTYADVEEPSEFGGKKKRRRLAKGEDKRGKGAPGEKKPLRAGDIFKAGRGRKKMGRSRSR